MVMLFQTGSCILWFFVIPFLCGLQITRCFEKKYRTIKLVFLTGYLVLFSVFQVMYLFFVLFYNHFIPLVYGYLSIICLISILTLFIQFKRITPYFFFIKKESTHRNICEMFFSGLPWFFAFSLVAFQIYKTIIFQYPDGDDSFYTVTSVITNTNKNMYVNLPYTGETSVLDARHAFSAAPIMISFFSYITHIHPTVLTYNIYAVVILLLTYLTYWIIAEIIYENEKRNIPIFLIILNIIYLFGNSTIYLPTTFLLTRTSQGKAFLANLIPALCILGLLLIDKKKEQKEKNETIKLEVRFEWIFILMVMIVAGYTSTMGLVLAPLFIGISSIMFTIVYKNWKIISYCIVTMIPIAFLGALYLIKLY